MTQNFTHIVCGSSGAHSAMDAVREACEPIDVTLTRFVLIFAPTRYELGTLMSALAVSLPGVPAFGCTTAGQITHQGYDPESLLIVAFPKAHFRCSSVLLDAIHTQSVTAIAEKTEHTARAFGHTSGWDRMALLFVDGLSKREDILASILETVLGGVPVFGGSAGDGMQFKKTFVLHNGSYYCDAAVLVLIETSVEFTGLNFHHFEPTTSQVVITKADPEKRIVYEINGAPATQEYARLVGCDVSELGAEVFAQNPMLVQYKNSYYVRAIQNATEENALSFMAAIDDGLVMMLGRTNHALDVLKQELDVRSKRQEEPDFILAFDCVLRKLEFEQRGMTGRVSDVMKQNRVFGFNTYGEQHGGAHINQTFVGVAFFKPREGFSF